MSEDMIWFLIVLGYASAGTNFYLFVKHEEWCWLVWSGIMALLSGVVVYLSFLAEIWHVAG